MGGGNFAWADDVAYNVVMPIDYSVNSTPSWVAVTGAGNSVEFADGVCIHYNNTSSGYRTNYLDLMKTNFTEDNWTLKFDAAIKSGSNGSGHGIAIYGTGTTFSTSSGLRQNQDIYDNNVYFALKSKESGGTVFSTIIGTTASDDVTLTAGSFYTYTISLTGISENVGTLNITIAPTAGGDAVFSKTVANFDISTLGRFYGIWSRTARHSSKESKTTNGWTKFDNIKLTSTKAVDALNTPTATLYSVDGNNRGILLSSEYADATIYYSTDNGVSFSNCQNNSVLQISATTTYKLYAKVGDMTSETITSSEFVAGVAQELNQATLTHSASGVYTITNEQTSVPLSPTATVHYRLGSGEEQTSTATSITLNVTEDAILTYWLTATGYAQTDEVNENVYASITKTQDYDLNFCTSNSNAWAVKGDEVTVGTSTYYKYLDQSNNIIGDGIIAANFNNDGNSWRIQRYYGGTNPYGKTESIALLNMKKGQIIVFQSDQLSSTTNLTLLPAETYTGHYGYIVSADENVTVSYAKGANLKHIYIYTTPIRIAIDNCKTYETSAAFANYIEGKYDSGDFSTASEVYAAHTAWQIAQAKANGSTDLTKLIRNAAVTSTDDWGGSRVITLNEQYTGAPDNIFIDANNQTLNVNQTIYGVPAGTYTIKAATRAATGIPGTLYVNDGSSDIGKVNQITNVGNTGGDLGNGWSWSEMTFTLTETKDLLIGFWTNAAGGWAGCDDWHMTLGGVSATIGATGWTTFASPYALNLSNMTASEGEVKAYYASAVGGSSVTMTTTEAAIQAGEGIMLKGTPTATITIPIVTSGSAIDGNKLVGVTTNTTITKETENYANFFVLSNNNGTAEFQNLKNWLESKKSGSDTEYNTVTINAGKAYLDATGATGARLSIAFDDETTGVQELKNSKIDGLQTGDCYNLRGQRVSQPTKGLYIVNGKKVIMK